MTPLTRDESAGVIIARVIEREGGIADVGDGAGLTRFGQTPGWLAQWGLPAPSTPGDAAANYRTWLVRTRLIGVCDHADAFGDGVVDWAVNSGHVPAIRAMQKALGVPADGILGPETQDAIDACDRAVMGRKVIAARVRFFGRLLADQPARSKFAAGWMNRMADQIEALA